MDIIEYFTILIEAIFVIIITAKSLRLDPGRNYINQYAFINKSNLSKFICLVVILIGMITIGLCVYAKSTFGLGLTFYIIGNVASIITIYYYYKIYKGNYYIVEDVLSKKDLDIQIKNKILRSYYYLKFEKLYNDYGKIIKVDETEFNNAKEGDIFFIVCSRFHFTAIKKEDNTGYDKTKLCSYETLLQNNIVKNKKN